MPRYDEQMRQKCRDAALRQHKNMTYAQKIARSEKLSVAYKKAKSLGKNPGHHVQHTEETKNKISNNRRNKCVGKSNPAWKGGILSLRNKIRGSSKYKRWRDTVFKRDNYTCRMCGSKGGHLHAHHIVSFADNMDNYDINNGTTLCYKCHEKVHGVKLGKGSTPKNNKI